MVALIKGHPVCNSGAFALQKELPEGTVAVGALNLSAEVPIRFPWRKRLQEWVLKAWEVVTLYVILLNFSFICISHTRALQVVYISDERALQEFSIEPAVDLCAGNARHYPIPGVLTLRGGAREAVIMHIYLRSQQRGSVVVFRGFMFAESVERDWYSLFDGYVCQPDVPQEAWPGITLR